MCECVCMCECECVRAHECVCLCACMFGITYLQVLIQLTKFLLLFIVQGFLNDNPYVALNDDDDDGNNDNLLKTYRKVSFRCFGNFLNRIN